MKALMLCSNLFLLFNLLTQPILIANATRPDDHLFTQPDQPLLVLLRRSHIKPPTGTLRDVLVTADPAKDELARLTAAMYSDPASYPCFVLRLHQWVKNYAAHNTPLSEAERVALNEPTYFFLSDRQGGFPAQGFWLEQADGTLRDMNRVPFVDVQFEAESLNGNDFGDIDQIFAHELGHLLLRELTGEPEGKASNAVHFITVRTDAWYAFDEGWGEHFQPAAIDHSRSAAIRARRAEPLPSATTGWYARYADELAKGCVFCPANLTFLLWQGKSEQRLRDSAVRDNHFIYQAAWPPTLLSDGRDPYEMTLYRDVVPPIPGAPLKNGAQMLASEGVISTLFYRLVTDVRLQNAYREPAFYDPFLRPGQSVDWARVKPQDLFTPEENVYLKLLDIMAQRVTWKVGRGPSPMIQLIGGYAERFPDEAEAVYDIFLDVTRDVTVDPVASTRHTQPNYLTALRSRLVRGEIKLDDNLGTPLWLSNTDFRRGLGVFRYLPLSSPYNFDLNAADAADLRTVPGVTSALAEHIIAAREQRGHFDGLQDLAPIEGITPALLDRFQRMRAEMEKELDARPKDDPGLLSLLLTFLVGSYALAALFQIIEVLLVAALVNRLIGGLPGLLNRSHTKPRSWLRRGSRAIAHGLKVAFSAFLISLAFYLARLPVTPVMMAAVGLFAWSSYTLLRVLFTHAALDRRQAGWSLTACIASFAAVGSMY